MVEAMTPEVPSTNIELDLPSSIDHVDINQSASESNKNVIQDLLGWLRMPKFSKWCFFISIAFAVVVITAFIIYTDLKEEPGGGNVVPPQPPQPQKAPFLKDYFLYHSIAPSLFNGTFITGKDFYYYDSLRNLAVYDLETKRSDIILPFTSWILLNGTFNFWFSEDLKYMMYASYNNPIYRHSYYAVYQVYNFHTRKSTYVTTNNLQLALMAPGTNGVAYVDKNNIYYRAHPENETADVRLTSDGVSGKIYNGVPDWVYEEEIISSNSAMWFSRKGSHLAYFKFNDSNVLIQAIPVYGPPNLKQWQYTRYDQIHYPKVGTANPTVSVHVVSLAEINNGSLETPKVFTYSPPLDLLDGKEPIASGLSWVNDTQFVVVWMNRYQNTLILQLCEVAEENPCRTVFNYHEPKGWLALEDPRFDANGDRMTFIWWHKQSNGDSYPHVTVINLTDAEPQLFPVTSGTFSVSEIVGWNLDTDEIYFLASISEAPEQLRTFKVLAHEPYTMACVSCNHRHAVDGSNCTYAGALFSNNAHYYALSCAGPGVPEVTIYNTEGKELMVWEDNMKTRSFVESITMPVKRILDVPVEDGFIARVQLLLPPELADFDETKDYGKKYPLLVNVYGGPDSSMVKDMFSTDFNTYMVANKSIIGVAIDGRGSNLMGLSTRYAIYKKLGEVEVADQLSVIKYLQEKYSFIDRNRTASWGWSYGGYATGMMLAEDVENRIKCGVSIAPVTDWVYYDSIYTERFMQTFDENLAGYMRASLLNRSSKLKDKMFFLIHGTKDDNVHYQNSMQLAKLLARSDIPFRQMTYPDEDHALKFVQPHFYHAIEDFLDECFFEPTL